MQNKTILALPFIALLSGCAITGLDAKTEFKCKPSAGVPCSSLEEIQQAGRSNSQNATRPVQSEQQQISRAKSAVEVNTVPQPVAGAPVFYNPTIRRGWINAWTDTDGDVYGQSYIWARVDTGKFNLNQVRRDNASTFTPLLPPNAAQPAAPLPAPTQQPAKPEIKSQGAQPNALNGAEKYLQQIMRPKDFGG